VFDQLLITAILIGALVLFLQERIRADAVALLALLACHLVGLLTVRDALSGFSSRAVLTVAAVLIIGRTIEATGAAAALARFLVPDVRFVTIKFAAIMFVSVIMSAFMNNIAALVIMMPATIALAKEHRLPPSSLLMPLAFATVLGGMTTLIGTPGNLIISSVREDALGSPYRLFDMTYVGGAVALAGMLYLALIGWRIAPRRTSADRFDLDPVRVFELEASADNARDLPDIAELRRRLRRSRAVLLAIFRNGERVRLEPADEMLPGDRAFVMAKALPWDVADRAKLAFAHARREEQHMLVAHVSVAHRSRLIGKRYSAVHDLSRGELSVVAVGPRPARLKQPLETLVIQAGDQLSLYGPESALLSFVEDMGLLEIERQVLSPGSSRPALAALGIYAVAVAAAGFFALPVSIVMITAALAMCLLRLISPPEIYRSIDWQVIVLLAAFIPIGRAFHDTGATQTVADLLSWSLDGSTLPVIVAVLCASSMLLSCFLNNVATALVMGQVGVEAARTMGIDIDAALLAVLIGSSCSFLTPIAHQNNLLVMRPGGYRFADYVVAGTPLTVLVVAVTTVMITSMYG
jgi:di/tricarboxylate transporter